ncbi:MAG: right-handed parallel beta-helix repeat-containing protein, partial [Chloroflexi bacterium]|nr:right-handed parallel beta-helix repeat-containing protein [Chloroflexota bacterium]
GNLIRHNGYDGVSLQGLPPGNEDVNHHNVVENNHIHYCGELVGHAAGVHISQSGFNEITHNHIHHIPRYGTTIKGVRYQVLKTQVPGVTFENRHDFLHSRNNLVAYNDIHHVNLDSQDTGAMESWGPGRDNVYDHNLIHEVGNDQFDLQSGMYLDDATDYFTVTNNIIWGVVGTQHNQCVYAKGIGNKFINNVFVVGPTNGAGISSYFMADERCDHHEYVRNILVFTEPTAAIYNFYNWTKDRVTRADENVFWKPEGELFIKMAGDTLSYEEWRERGLEKRSVVADPLFVNPEERDYHLLEGSPAFDLGIEDIDTDGIGLEDDFPERFERE